jgi:hypothetical protein
MKILLQWNLYNENKGSDLVCVQYTNACKLGASIQVEHDKFLILNNFFHIFNVITISSKSSFWFQIWH